MNKESILRNRETQNSVSTENVFMLTYCVRIKTEVSIFIKALPCSIAVL